MNSISERMSATKFLANGFILVAFVYFLLHLFPVQPAVDDVGLRDAVHQKVLTAKSHISKNKDSREGAASCTHNPVFAIATSVLFPRRVVDAVERRVICPYLATGPPLSA